MISLMAVRCVRERMLAVHASSTDVNAMVTLMTDEIVAILETRMWSMIGYTWPREMDNVWTRKEWGFWE
jgi:hypothetical protein